MKPAPQVMGTAWRGGGERPPFVGPPGVRVRGWCWWQRIEVRGRVPRRRGRKPRRSGTRPRAATVWGPSGGKRGGGQHAERRVRPVAVVVVAPVGDHDPSFGQTRELLDVQQLVADTAVERLDERVLPRCAGLNECRLDR